jgi:NitT/TauT family transport system ATP-binding protein
MTNHHDSSTAMGTPTGRNSAAATRGQVHIEHLVKTFVTDDGPLPAIADMSLSIEEGEFVTIVGPSGCGKSTLLRIVLGIVPPTQGTILLRGMPIDGPQPGIGMVFQSPVLMRWRTVLENVLLPIEIIGHSLREYRQRALDLIDLVGLKGFENRYPRELSGGMQQRVAICRALIHDPSLLLMDEPFGALDALTREQMSFELLRIWAGRRKTVLFVTHDIEEAVFLADRVIAMTPRPGRLSIIEDVRLPRPRTGRMRSSPEFVGHVQRLRSALGLLHDDAISERLAPDGGRPHARELNDDLRTA